MNGLALENEMITLVGELSLAQWYQMSVLWRSNPQCDMDPQD